MNFERRKWVGRQLPRECLHYKRITFFKNQYGIVIKSCMNCYESWSFEIFGVYVCAIAQFCIELPAL